MEKVVIVAIVILGTVFIASLLILIFICKHRLNSKNQEDYIGQEHEECSGERQPVVCPSEAGASNSNSFLELSDVGFPDLEQWLENEEWVDDATGLVPHCLSVLRVCHHLTERIISITMNTGTLIQSRAELDEIVTITKEINPRVDETLRAMYPPLDPRLLEARCTALFMSVRHLVMICQSHCRDAYDIEWIARSLEEVEKNLKVLREASGNYDVYLKSLYECENCDSVSVTTTAAAEETSNNNASTL